MHFLDLNPAGARARALPHLNIPQSHASLRRAQEKHA
jgi:hypothetical protein